MTEEWTLRWTTTRLPPWASARQTVWLPCEAPLIRNQVRRAPGLGGEQLRLLEGRRFGADVDPSVTEGMSLRSPASPTSSRIAGSAPGPPLWPGTWKRPGSSAA